MDATQPRLTALPRGLTAATVAALLVAAASASAMLAVTLDILAFATKAGSALEPANAYPASFDLEVPVRLTTLAVWVIAAVLWTVWFARTLTAAARIAPLRAEPALSVTLLFLPVVNWVVGKRAVNDVWRVTGGARSVGSSPLIQVWWGITILFTIAVPTAIALTPVEAEYLEDQLTGYRADAVAYGLGTVAALFGALATWRLARRVTAALLVAPPASPRPDTITIGAPIPAAERARGRGALAVRCARWGVWGCVLLVALYLVITAAVWAARPNTDVLAGIELAIAGPVAMALLVPFIIWLAWFHAAVTALHERVGGTSPGWAVASWFIPPFWFVTPWRVLARLVPTPGPGLRAVRVAWVAWVLSLIAIAPTIVVGVAGVDDLSAWRWYAPLTACAYALAAISAAGLAAATRRVVEA